MTRERLDDERIETYIEFTEHDQAHQRGDEYRDILLQVLHDLQATRDTNRKLNRRAQKADAAAADAKRCLYKLAEGTEKGTPWCGGSMGRGLLAWHCEKLEEALRVIATDPDYTNPEAMVRVARAALGEEGKTE